MRYGEQWKAASTLYFRTISWSACSRRCSYFRFLHSVSACALFGSRILRVLYRARPRVRLKYLDGGHGDGCNEVDDRFTKLRRSFHHFTFYGFWLCFASTTVATLYHYVLNLPAPYGYISLPKLFGISGGISLMVGTAGQWWLHLRRNPLQQDARQRSMDRGFIGLLFLIAASGLALMWGKHQRHADSALPSSCRGNGAIHDFAVWEVRPWCISYGRSR